MARTIDSDRKHLTSVLRAAADHKGTAFVEIYQNCPIFNDDAFLPVTEPGQREQRLIRLEDGQPIRFGADASLGLRFGRYGALEAVPAAGADEDHCSRTTSGPIRPTRSRSPGSTASDFAHTPIGVFRAVERASYDDLMTAQIESAREKQGDGDLADLLAGSDTWQVG